MSKRVNLKITGYVGEGLKKYILKNIGTEGAVDVYVASAGGSVIEAQEMIVAFQAAVDAGREVNFYVASRACSCASWVPTAVKGARLYMAGSSQLMFHGPYGWMEGGADAMGDYAELLERLRVDIKGALSSKGVKVEDEWFAEGRMKWYSAKEALDARIADGIRNPPLALVTAAGYEPVSWRMVLLGDLDAGARMRPHEMKAAASGIEELLAHEARQRFGLAESAEVGVEVTGDGVVFSGVSGEVDGALLKIGTDGDMLPIINWEGPPPVGGGSPVASEGEGIMAGTKEPDVAAELDKAKLEAKAEGYKTGFDNGFAEGKAQGEAEGFTKGEAKGKADAQGAFGEAEALAKLGISADALAYARENYDAACEACRATILGVKETAFTEDELKAMPYSSLMKIAGTVASAGGTPRADRSVFGAPSAKGSVPVESQGSVPPPADTWVN